MKIPSHCMIHMIFVTSTTNRFGVLFQAGMQFSPNFCEIYPENFNAIIPGLLIQNIKLTILSPSTISEEVENNDVRCLSNLQPVISLCFTSVSLASFYEISTFQVAEQFWVKEKHFAMGVLHGTGSNREEITRFAVKRLNVPLLATVTVMPHTHTVYPRFPVSTCNHTHTWHDDMMISHLFTITNPLSCPAFFRASFIFVFLPKIFGLKHFPKFYLIGGREFRRLHQAVLIFINLLHIWQTPNVFSWPMLNIHERRMKCMAEYFCQNHRGQMFKS